MWFSKAKKPKLSESTVNQAPLTRIPSPRVFSVADFQRPTYSAYRKMRSHPTIALARAAATAPIRSANIGVVGEEDSPEREFIESQWDWIRGRIIPEMLLALDYGFQAFEKVYELRKGKIFLTKLKALYPDQTSLLVDEHGRFNGIKQGETELSVENSFLYTNDGEHGNLYGRSRQENIREFAFIPWLELCEAQLKYALKVSGKAGFVGYTPGTAIDPITGAEISGVEEAQRVVSAIENGNIAFGPKTSEELSATGLSGLDVRFLDMGANQGQAFGAMLKDTEAQFIRGWLIPERAITEGRFGTKAEAAEHADIGMTLAGEVLEDIIRTLNWHIVDPLLALNFGEIKRGSVYLEAESVNESERAFQREISKMLLSGESIRLVDVKALMDECGIPMKEVIE